MAPVVDYEGVLRHTRAWRRGRRARLDLGAVTSYVGSVLGILILVADHRDGVAPISFQDHVKTTP